MCGPLANHFPPKTFDSVLASKRQITYFLSYIARAAAFWSKCPGLIKNEVMVHQGSVFFEQVS